MARNTPSSSRRTQAPKSGQPRSQAKRVDRRRFWIRVVAILAILGMLLPLFGALLSATL